MDDGGFVSIMARTDDVLNVAGHRISTKSLEEVKYFIALILGSAWFKWNNILAIATDLSVYLQDLVRSLSINASSETYRRNRNNFFFVLREWFVSILWSMPHAWDLRTRSRVICQLDL